MTADGTPALVHAGINVSVVTNAAHLSANTSHGTVSVPVIGGSVSVVSYTGGKKNDEVSWIPLTSTIVVTATGVSALVSTSPWPLATS